MEENKKKVDENWKEQTGKEKVAPQEKKDFVPPAPDFNFFITTLALQAAIALGQMPNPSTNKTEEDLTQAKFLIDTIGMLQEKTKGNLTKEEETLVENLLYELRMQYVTKTKNAEQGGKQ
ncbi:MAG: DUF1844 domain-containing protein [Candidatus Omnitrophica bacterium]|nr:DUF1844 domain-containing protein [Candidatus Omnitrophota bacterium]MBU1869623.1 DUF1844 domain-containing protein [Candidatus Omnitrophota bacterium]